MTNTGEFVPKPMPLPPLPKLNIPEQIEDRASADTPKIDLTPIDAPKIDDKPTEEQVDGFKPLLWVAIATIALIGFSFMQGGKTVSTEIQSTAPQTQNASAVDTEQPVKVPPEKPKALPMPERDPDKANLNLLLSAYSSEAGNTLDQLVESRAAFLKFEGQQLAIRNPIAYPDYLLKQTEKVNLELAALVKTDQTTLTGTDAQIAIASKLLVNSLAVALELIRYKVAIGQMSAEDVPERLRSRLIPTAISPYILLAARSRDFSNITDLNKRSLLADREQELARVAKEEYQNLQTAQNGVPQPKKQATLPVPAKEGKK
jgi:hypothetical protein